jgi:hypothetical protein
VGPQIPNSHFADEAELAQRHLDGQSRSRVLVGRGSTSKPIPGQVLLYAGGPSPSSTPFASITAPADHPDVNGGAIFDLDGDGPPEILVEQSSSPNTSGDINTQVAIYSGSNNYAALARVLPSFMANDDFGISMSQ